MYVYYEIMKYTRHKKNLLIGCFVIYVSHELSKTANAKYGVKLIDPNTFDIPSSLH